MWKTALAFMSKLFTLTHQTDDNVTDIRKLQEDVDALTEEMVALRTELRRLVAEIRHDR
jgi:hypothetical protein